MRSKGSDNKLRMRTAWAETLLIPHILYKH